MSNDLTLKHRIQEPRTVDTFAVIDLDRTLLNTDVLAELLYSQLHEYGFTPEQVAVELSFIQQQTGKSFPLFDHISKTHGSELLENILEKTLLLAEDGDLDADTLLCKGAAQLLELLERKDVPHAILTYGNELDQAFKLSLVRKLLRKTEQELPAAITDEPRKAAWIAATWDDIDQGAIAIPGPIAAIDGLRAHTIIIIDDKLSNLESDSKSVKGILVNNTESAPAGHMSTSDLVRHIDRGMSLGQIAQLQEDEQRL